LGAPLEIDLLVLGYGQFENTTKKCLESLIPQVNQLNAQIYVLDNGSPDNSYTLQNEFCNDYPQITSFYSENNLGYAAGMNYLANKSSNEWLILVGSDTIFYPNALTNLTHAISTAPHHVGLLGPVTNSAGTAQCLQALGSEVGEVFANAKETFNVPSGITLPLYRADFFCVAIRRTVWDQLGGLDTSYGLGYYEDFDFSMRAKKLGYQCVMVEDALVFHQGSASFKKPDQQSELLKKNKIIFVQRFPDAELRHVREDLLLSINSLLQIDSAPPSIKPMELNSLIKHIQLRIDSLSQNRPKGLLKKILWKRRVKVIISHFKIWQKYKLLK
jgi:GT2 family glycosyltransferase